MKLNLNGGTMNRLNKKSSSEYWVLGVAIVCFALGLIVAPLASPGAAAAQWVPIAIGAFLAYQYWVLRRRRTTPSP